MKFKVDENLSTETASIFHEQGFEADTASDESLSGVDDEAIAKRVRGENRILVTLGVGCGEPIPTRKALNLWCG